MKTQIEQIAKIYGINMNVELVSGVEYDGLTELNDCVYNIKINENANDETFVHELGHVIVNEMDIKHPRRMEDVVMILKIGNDEVLADIIGNLVFQYEFGETPRDMTYVFANENELNNVIDAIIDVFGAFDDVPMTEKTAFQMVKAGVMTAEKAAEMTKASSVEAFNEAYNNWVNNN